VVSRITRAHHTWRNPVRPQYTRDLPVATVRFGYCYERDGEQRIMGLKSLDLGPDPVIEKMGWRPLFKVRVKPKR